MGRIADAWDVLERGCQQGPVSALWALPQDSWRNGPSVHSLVPSLSVLPLLLMTDGHRCGPRDSVNVPRVAVARPKQDQRPTEVALHAATIHM